MSTLAWRRVSVTTALGQKWSILAIKNCVAKYGFIVLDFPAMFKSKTKEVTRMPDPIGQRAFLCGQRCLVIPIPAAIREKKNINPLTECVWLMDDAGNVTLKTLEEIIKKADAAEARAV